MSRHNLQKLVNFQSASTARALERHWQAQLQKAQLEAKIRENKIRADVDAVRTERDRLRQQLASNQAKLSTVSRNTVIEYAATLGDIFEQCAKRLEDVARAADGHANDALMLSGAFEGEIK